MPLFDQLSDLPIQVDSYALDGLERDVSSEFTRLTTVITLRGGGEEGIGEDVVYDQLDHIAFQDAGPVHDFTTPRTLGEFCDLIHTLDLFPAEPVRPVSRLYRRWAFESAALDLALRQSGESLHARLGITPSPVTFVVSLRLGEPPSIEPLRQRLASYPTLRFKLDPTPSWDEDLIAQLVATGAVDSVDLKGHYKGTPVDVGTDPVLYERVIAAFPDAWIEDPAIDEVTEPLLADVHDRITWDAVIHGVEEIEALPFPPKMVNVKPSRAGGLRELCEVYDYCAERGIRMYGGGQFELGPGRGHIQYLASLFHPDTPNDVSPAGFHAPDPPAGLPVSPLPPVPSPVGFRWGA
jgi:L-alanine-DL-glutamate epimerase-like enolase superfamily enzyme